MRILRTLSRALARFNRWFAPAVAADGGAMRDAVAVDTALHELAPPGGGETPDGE